MVQEYSSRLNRKQMIVAEPARQPDYWLRYPVALQRNRHERDEICEQVASETRIEVGPYNWAVPVDRMWHIRKWLRTGPGSRETAELIDGLINLPVHDEMTSPRIGRLVDALNRA